MNKFGFPKPVGRDGRNSKSEAARFSKGKRFFVSSLTGNKRNSSGPSDRKCNLCASNGRKRNSTSIRILTVRDTVIYVLRGVRKFHYEGKFFADMKSHSIA